jgi:cell division protein FtsL
MRRPLPSPVVDSDDGRRRLGMGLIGLVVLGLTAVATAHVAVHAKRIETAIALGKEQQRFQELAEKHRMLEIEMGMLKDPRRLTQLAQTQLGMGPVDPNHIRPIHPRAVPR